MILENNSTLPDNKSRQAFNYEEINCAEFLTMTETWRVKIRNEPNWIWIRTEPADFERYNLLRNSQQLRNGIYPNLIISNQRFLRSSDFLDNTSEFEVQNFSIVFRPDMPVRSSG